jgi:hypothetical protein
MALQSARHAGLTVPSEVFDRAKVFLDSVQKGKHGGLYGYMPERSPENTMIAEGLLCREYLGWPADHPGLAEGSKYLLNNLPKAGSPNIYYWYYATQTMHHLGGEGWNTWNTAMRDTLIEMQSDNGHEAGSWDPVGGALSGHDTQAGGRLYMTALSICTLEVYYRHLPIYRRIELTAPVKKEPPGKKEPAGQSKNIFSSALRFLSPVKGQTLSSLIEPMIGSGVSTSGNL